MKGKGIRYIDEFRDKTLVRRLIEKIKESARLEYSFMEVCGGHTAAIHRFGIPSLLPPNIRLLSGPGCPVCVTGIEFIDKAVDYSKRKNFIITTFGDLIRVPGSSTSLEKAKAAGSDVRIVFSGLEALEIAATNPGSKVVFPGIGFETTAPGTAVTLKEAGRRGIKNFFVLSAHKIMPPAMDAIINDGVRLNGFICPGHVATITGSYVFNFIPEKYRLGCVITGFEPLDLLQSIYLLIQQVNNNDPLVEIQYSRAVKKEGNLLARRQISDVFCTGDAHWRGFGNIPDSGLHLKERFVQFDAEKVYPVNVISGEENKSCLCGEILRGLKMPSDCSLFSGGCTPDHPVGACMVSDEGACNSFYRYSR